MPIQFSVAYDPDFTLYALVLDPSDRAWNGTAFVDPAGARPTCDVPMVYDAPTGTYVGTVPSSLPSGPTGTYTVRSYLQLGATPDDGDPVVGVGTVTVTAAVVARASTDRFFLRGLAHVVAVQVNLARDGSVVGQMGAASPPNWQPVAGLEAVACRIGEFKPQATEGAGRPGQMTEARVLFGREIAAGRGYRLVRQDPAFGLRYYYLTGKVFSAEDAKGVFHHAVGVVRDAPL
jgi:hypothetical protein